MEAGIARFLVQRRAVLSEKAYRSCGQRWSFSFSLFTTCLETTDYNGPGRSYSGRAESQKSMGATHPPDAFYMLALVGYTRMTSPAYIQGAATVTRRATRSSPCAYTSCLTKTLLHITFIGTGHTWFTFYNSGEQGDSSITRRYRYYWGKFLPILEQIFASFCEPGFYWLIWKTVYIGWRYWKPRGKLRIHGTNLKILEFKNCLGILTYYFEQRRFIRGLFWEENYVVLENIHV